MSHSRTVEQQGIFVSQPDVGHCKARLSIRSLFALTILAALLACVYSRLGLPAMLFIGAILHGIAPTLAILTHIVLRREATSIRLIVPAVLLLGILLAMLGLASLQFGSQVISVLCLATLVEWPSQIPLAIILGLILSHRLTDSGDSKEISTNTCA